MTAYFTHIIIIYYEAKSFWVNKASSSKCRHPQSKLCNKLVNYCVILFTAKFVDCILDIPDGKMNSNGKKDYDFLFKVDRQLKAVVVLCHGRIYVIMFVSMV